jgi:Arc/MetJ-type ribon-helix-helix transcriptional regulator
MNGAADIVYRMESLLVCLLKEDPGKLRSVFSRLTPASVLPNLKTMEVQLTTDQKAFIRRAIETGRLHREEDAIEEALSLWEERERARAEVLAAVDQAEASIARDEGRIITEQSMRDLAEDVKQRGRARLAAEQSAKH